MPRIMQRALGLLGGLGLVAALAMPVAAQNEAFVRVVHASPDAPNVDVWVDGETVLTDVPFTAVSDYLTLPAGTYNVQVTATGSTEPVIDADLTLDAGMSYTVAATGLLADITATVLDRRPNPGRWPGQAARLPRVAERAGRCRRRRHRRPDPRRGPNLPGGDRLPDGRRRHLPARDPRCG